MQTTSLPDRSCQTDALLCPLVPARSLARRYRHLARTTWDIEFLTKPEWVAWLDDQITASVPAPGEALVDYVRNRVEQIKSGNSTPQPQPQSRPQPVQAPQPAYSVLPPAAPATMNGTNGHDEFSEMLDLTSYAHDDSAANGFGVDGFSSSSAGAPLSAASAYPSSTQHHRLYSTFSPSPSPIPSYSGAIAPFSQPPPNVYSGAITPFTPGGATTTPYSSTLALQGQLINEERQRSQAAAAAQQQQQAGGYLQPTSSQSFFDPSAFHQQPQQVAPQTITPSFLSGAPTPVASTSSVKSKKPSSSGRASSPATASGATTKRSRTASPPSSSSYDPSHWTSISTTLRPYLSSKRLQGSPTATAGHIIKALAQLNHTDRASTLSPWGDASDVPPEGRAEVLTSLVKYAEAEFWDAWVAHGAKTSGAKGKEKENGKVKSDGLEILQRWLEGAARGYAAKSKEEEGKAEGEKEKKKEKERERKRRELEQGTLALVLQVLTKLPVTLDHLIAYPSVPKLVKRISDRASDGAVKAAATQSFAKWSKLQEKARAAQAKNGSSSSASTSTSSTSAKRKSDEKDGPVKKLKPTTEQTKKPVLPVAAKLALPSFAKKKAADAPPPASVSPFAAAMSGLKKKETPAPPPPPPPLTTVQAALNTETQRKAALANAAIQAQAQDATGGAEKVKKMGKNGKPKKSVRWRPDEELVAIREIEKAIYEDDENSSGSGARVFAEGEDAEANFRDMNLQEGQTLTMHLDMEDEMDEEIDYYEPIPVIIPDNEDFASFRQEPVSREATLQAEREASIMAVDVESTSAPPSPGEPPEYTPAEPDPATATMQLSAALAADDAFQQTIEMAQAAAPPSSVFAQNEDLTSLLGELASGGLASTLAALQPLTPTHSGAPPPTPLIDEATRAQLRNFRPDEVEAIIRQDPRFAGLTLEQLGMAPSPAAMHGAPPPPAHDQYQGYVPPAQQDNYHAGGVYGQPWQPPATAPYHPPAQTASWPPQPNYATPVAPNPSAYNGYVPPANPGAAGPPQLQTSHVHNAGWRNKVACRFFKSPRGCDRGELCAFRHDL
ncbi:hypothetical protein JCM11251_000553 [Rhodosporidiobolus azoricus]